MTDFDQLLLIFVLPLSGEDGETMPPGDTAQSVAYDVTKERFEELPLTTVLGDADGPDTNTGSSGMQLACACDESVEQAPEELQALTHALYPPPSTVFENEYDVPLYPSLHTSPDKGLVQLPFHEFDWLSTRRW